MSAVYTVQSATGRPLTALSERVDLAGIMYLGTPIYIWGVQVHTPDLTGRCVYSGDRAAAGTHGDAVQGP